MSQETQEKETSFEKEPISEEQNEAEKSKIFKVLFTGRVIARLQFTLVQILWPAFLYDTRPDITLFWIGLVMASMQAGVFIGLPFAGSLTSKIGHKNCFVLGQAGYFIFQILFNLCVMISDDQQFLTWSMVTRLLLGFSTSFINISSQSIISKEFETEREEYMARNAMSDVLGFFVGMIYLFIFAGWTDVYTILYIDAAQVGLFGLYSKFALNERCNHYESNDKNLEPVSWSCFFTNKMAFTSMWSNFLIFFVAMNMTAAGPVVLRTLGFGDLMIGVYGTVTYGMIIVSILLIKSRIQSWKAYRIRTYAFIPLTLAFILYAFQDKYLYLVAGIMMSLALGPMGVCFAPDLLSGTEKAIRLKNIQEGYPDKKISIQLQDKCASLVQAVIMIPSALGPSMGGLVYDLKGYTFLCIINVLICLITGTLHIIAIYCYNPQSNLIDYLTLDGTRPLLAKKDEKSDAQDQSNVNSTNIQTTVMGSTSLTEPSRFKDDEAASLLQDMQK